MLNLVQLQLTQSLWPTHTQVQELQHQNPTTFWPDRLLVQQHGSKKNVIYISVIRQEMEEINGWTKTTQNGGKASSDNHTRIEIIYDLQIECWCWLPSNMNVAKTLATSSLTLIFETLNSSMMIIFYKGQNYRMLLIHIYFNFLDIL